MMGRSERDLKNETYRTYIKTFMSKIGKIYIGNNVTAEQIEADFAEVAKFNGAGIAIAPIYFDVIKNIKKKNEGVMPVSATALIGYPAGLSTLDGKQTDIKECLKDGAGSLLLVFPTAAISLGVVEDLKNEYARIAKKSKVGVGIAVNPDYPEEHLKKLMELIDDTHISTITLIAERLEIKELSKFVSSVASHKGAKKLCVHCSLSTFDEISSLLKRGADKIYTSYFDALGEELIQKFNVEL